MHSRILIVDAGTDPHILRLQIREAMARCDGNAACILADLLDRQQASLANLASAMDDCVLHFHRLKADLLKVAYEQHQFISDRAEVLQGIADTRAWLDRQIRHLLTFSPARSFLRRVVFQPCWSAKRWKSLT